jgi:putative ABC transport system permease protein
MVRQKRRFTGWLGIRARHPVDVRLVVHGHRAGAGGGDRHHPWYAPQYAIPLLGMILGNTMNGIALGSTG